MMWIFHDFPPTLEDRGGFPCISLPASADPGVKWTRVRETLDTNGGWAHRAHWANWPHQWDGISGENDSWDLMILMEYSIILGT